MQERSTAAADFWMSADAYANRLSDPDAIDEFSALGVFPVVFIPVDERSAGTLNAKPRLPAAGIFIGVDRDGIAPAGLEKIFDILLTTSENASTPYVFVAGQDIDHAAAQLYARVKAFPVAATTLAQILRSGETASFADALVLESLAYSTLLGGAEFRRWRADVPIRRKPPTGGPMVRTIKYSCGVSVVLSRPEAHNAFCAQMRDEVVATLRGLLLDPEIDITLTGEGPSFCSGGDLDEFGSAADIATAHAIRFQRSVALLVHQAARRISARLHGSCIGAGIEIAAAAHRVVATPDVRIRLPEVGMGLVPGAGGTVTIPRRVGRHRACYMALSGVELNCDTARGWGLIDELESS